MFLSAMKSLAFVSVTSSGKYFLAFFQYSFKLGDRGQTENPPAPRLRYFATLCSMNDQSQPLEPSCWESTGLE